METQSNLVVLKCIKCTPTTTGGFRLTYEEQLNESEQPLQESKPTALGTSKPKPRKYARKWAFMSLDNVPVGTMANIDMKDWDERIEEKIQDWDETSDSYGETVKIYWLNPK